MSHRMIHIGCAAGFGGDRTDAGVPIVKTLVACGEAGALIYEMLAERTLALAQLERRKDASLGFAPLLEPMLAPVLQDCANNAIPIVGNFGAANPEAAARRIRDLAQAQGLSAPRIAIVSGDDLSDYAGRELLRRFLAAEDRERDIVSANVYLGATPVANALRDGAQIVVTGRIADPSLAVGVAMAHFGWEETDWDKLGRATMAGHLLECGAQVTGGYFADPGVKDVPDIHRVGYPIARISEDGSFTLGKADNTGGLVSAMTVKEQLLFELHDPATYLTPDVVADISEAEVVELGKNRVTVNGIQGHPRPETLKTTVCYPGGWMGEGEISFAGPNAQPRARLAADILRRRMNGALPLRFDIIGSISVLGDDGGNAFAAAAQSGAVEPCDVRLRVAGTHRDKTTVERLLAEVTALYTCGPAGGAGIRTAIRSRLHSTSCLIPRDLVPARHHFLD